MDAEVDELLRTKGLASMCSVVRRSDRRRVVVDERAWPLHELDCANASSDDNGAVSWTWNGISSFSAYVHVDGTNN